MDVNFMDNVSSAAKRSCYERTLFPMKALCFFVHRYPVGAYAVHMDPAMGPAAGRKLAKDLVNSQYIDLHTRLVMVEFTVYNAMLDRVCLVQAAAEFTKAGGVVPQFSFQTV
jgi:hypothetical protein